MPHDPSDSPSAGPVGSGASGVPRPALLLGVAGTVLALDLLTKQWIVENLRPHELIPVLGDFFRITYTHNFGAAFGIHVGEYSRVFFLALAVVALGVLAYLYLNTPRGRTVRLAAIALVMGGALGNVIDRIRFQRGVVDFLDVGIGDLRWPVFNVADMAVSVGAVLLVVSFYSEEVHRAAGERADGSGPGPADEERDPATGYGEAGG